MGKTGGVTGRSTPHVTTFILSRHCGSRPLLEFPTTTIWVGTLSGESYVLVSPMCCVLVEAGVMDGIAESQNSHVDRSSWFSDFSVPGIHSGQLHVERIDFLGAFIAHQQGRIIGTQPQPGGPRV